MRIKIKPAWHNLLLPVFYMFAVTNVSAQLITLPDAGVNYKCKTHRQLGLTEIGIKWNAPGVKGREGKIWGTDVAYYGYSVLGYGSTVQSPWRAGADESTTISFSTDVTINGKALSAGTYGFFIALYPDSCELIFNSNTAGWGSYFYNPALDVLRVGTKQQKDRKESKERLDYTFSKQTKESVEVALEWEYWRIPFTVTVDLKKTAVESLRRQLSGEMGFDPPSLETAAGWCLQNNVNLEEALQWINVALDPSLGAVKSFKALSLKSRLLDKLGRKAEADAILQSALENATAAEMHGYGRQLLSQNKLQEAQQVFEKNYSKNKGIWPTTVGMMRGYAANGDYKKALEYAKKALIQAPDEENRKAIEKSIELLKAGKPL